MDIYVTPGAELPLDLPEDDEKDPEVSIVIPALNEEITIGDFVGWCKEGIKKAGVRGEILIVDGSADNTPRLALEKGARVLRAPKRGLGRAYIDSVPYIRGKYVLLGDCDCTYDFRDISPFLEKFRAGYEFIMGSRLKGRIEKGAMPLLHRYFGTPVTTWLLNLVYRSRFSDIHCGMRGVTRDAFTRMDLRSQEWDYAPEMIIKSILMGLKSAEIPVVFRKDRTGRRSHLRASWHTPWYAGWLTIHSIFAHKVDFLLSRKEQRRSTNRTEVNYETFWDNNGAHSYHPSVRLRNDLITRILLELPFETLTDIGCGDGVLVKAIADLFPGKKLSASDVSSRAIRLNSKRYEGIEFSRYDITGKPRAGALFDVVVCSEVIEHLKDWKTALRHLYEMTAKNGHLLLTTQSGKRYKSDINVGHLQHFELKELKQSLESLGFKTIQAYKKGFPFYNLQKWTYQFFEEEAKDFQTGNTGKSAFGRMVFKITYFFFRLSLKSSLFGPQIFIVAKK
jgi:2-polyprenyl-3-methyl-5-hydroxy-6-metoxy-1,4-benzoquinol methylase